MKKKTKKRTVKRVQKPEPLPPYVCPKCKTPAEDADMSTVETIPYCLANGRFRNGQFEHTGFTVVNQCDQTTDRPTRYWCHKCSLELKLLADRTLAVAPELKLFSLVHEHEFGATVYLYRAEREVRNLMRLVKMLSIDFDGQTDTLYLCGPHPYSMNQIPVLE